MRSITRAVATFAFAMLAAFALVPKAGAQAWPQRSVRFILPLGPGSGTDIGGRVLADRLAKRWGQPVVIENKPGGDGLVAISAFVASSNDDHVLLMSPASAFTAHPFLHESLPYKTADLSPIARYSTTVIGITVPTVMPVKSLPELVALIRSKPGELNWAGITGALEFNLAGWLKANGLDMKKVPYRNPVEAANDLAENRIQVYQSAVAIAQPQLRTGKIKLLAITNVERAPAVADVPTVAEAGQPALTLDGLVGLFGPPSMPQALRERIAADIKAAMAEDNFIRDRLVATGQVPNPGGAKELQESIDKQRASLAANARTLGIELKAKQ